MNQQDAAADLRLLLLCIQAVEAKYNNLTDAQFRKRFPRIRPYRGESAEDVARHILALYDAHDVLPIHVYRWLMWLAKDAEISAAMHATGRVFTQPPLDPSARAFDAASPRPGTTPVAMKIFQVTDGAGRSNVIVARTEAIVQRLLNARRVPRRGLSLCEIQPQDAGLSRTDLDKLFIQAPVIFNGYMGVSAGLGFTYL